MLDDNGRATEATDEADALRRLRGHLNKRQNALYDEARDLLDDHLTAMRPLHPELSDAVGVLMDIFLGPESEHTALKPTLRMLGLAAPGVAVRAAALYEVSLLLEDSDLGRLRWRGLSSFEMELGLRERWMPVVKERLAHAFGGSAQKAVQEAAAERKQCRGLDAATE